MLVLSVTRPWSSTSRMWGGLPPPGCLHALPVPATGVMGTYPTVLDNFIKSLFGPTVAVTDSLWNRRFQEVTRDGQRPNTASPGPARHSYLPQPSHCCEVLAKFFRQSHHKISQFGKKFLFPSFCCYVLKSRFGSYFCWINLYLIHQFKITHKP
jgi:hypothetical protein